MVIIYRLSYGWLHNQIELCKALSLQMWIIDKSFWKSLRFISFSWWKIILLATLIKVWWSKQLIIYFAYFIPLILYGYGKWSYNDVMMTLFPCSQRNWRIQWIGVMNSGAFLPLSQTKWLAPTDMNFMHMPSNKLSNHRSYRIMI